MCMIQFMYLKIFIVVYCISITAYMNTYMNNYTVESTYLKLCQNTYVLQIFTIQFQWIRLQYPIKSSQKSS